MQARARKSALLEAAAVLVAEVLAELTEDGETETLSDVIETLYAHADTWESIESAAD